MDVVAEFGSAPAGSWYQILAVLAEAGVRVDEVGEEPDLLWCTCRRGRASVGLVLETAKATANVCVYAGLLRSLSSPRSTRRLLREVLSVVGACGRQAGP